MEEDLKKLKTDLETLIQDFKSTFGNLKKVVTDEFEDKKDGFEKQAKKHIKNLKNKIPSGDEIKENLEDHARSNLLKYLAGAFVVGIVVGSLISGSKKDND
jgi:ElaB/YqjD/DUF883 family membrane-anchored ribosome-binding protein